jgi:predicted permease
MEEELRFHLENKIDEGISRGLTAEQARCAAMRAMDGLEQRKEEIRDMRHIHWLTDFIDDAHYAARSLRRTPAFTALVVITLALGIGMTSATFSMLDAIILRPYPVPHPGGLVTLVSTTHDNSYDGFSYREYLDIRDHSKSLDGVIASTDMQPVGFSKSSTATPRIKGGLMVSGNYFKTLGVQPRLGRTFREDEDQVPGREAVVVLGPSFWNTEFGSDPAILGKHVRLNGTEFTVIGVAPETFPGMDTFSHPDFYLPLAMAGVFATNRQKSFFEDRDDRELNLIARLKPDAGLEQARNELTVVAKNFERRYPNLNLGRGAAVHTKFEMRTRPDDMNWKFIVVFVVLSLAVLFVACTNVAGLLLSRARARTREIAVRLAIGAGRFRLIRLLLTESLLLSSLGGILGIVVGYGCVQWFRSNQNIIFMTDLPASVPFRIDGRVLLACLAISVFSALLCGLAPALQSGRTNLVEGLKAGEVSAGRKRLWGRNVLVVAQVATSLMLLTAAFLMFRSFQSSALGVTGFAKDHLLMTSFDPRLVQYSPDQTQRFYKQLAERARQEPGVQNVALTENIPFGTEDADSISFVPDGFQMPRDRENFTAALDVIDHGYFKTMEIPILRGRAFRETDTADAPRVAIINEQFAKHYWPSQEAIGKHIRLEKRTGALVEVVGIAKTIQYFSATDQPMDFVYLPLAQHHVARMTLMLRSSGDPVELIAPLRDVVRTLDANLPMLKSMTYEDYYVNRAVEGPRIAVKIVAAMGVLGLLMAIAGLYGLIAYNVNRRTREIGIRMAIGADRSAVVRLVMRQGLTLVAVGTVLGLIMGFGVEQFLNSMLSDSGGGVDFVAYVTVVPSMFAVTLLAAYIPARKASQIEPTQALRYE